MVRMILCRNECFAATVFSEQDGDEHDDDDDEDEQDRGMAVDSCHVRIAAGAGWQDFIASDVDQSHGIRGSEKPCAMWRDL